MSPVRGDRHGSGCRGRGRGRGGGCSRGCGSADRLCHNACRSRDRSLSFGFLRQLPQRLTDILKAIGIGVLRGLIGIELILHNIFGFQKQVDDFGTQPHFTTAGTVEQVFQQMRGLLQYGKTESGRPP